MSCVLCPALFSGPLAHINVANYSKPKLLSESVTGCERLFDHAYCCGASTIFQQFLKDDGGWSWKKLSRRLRVRVREPLKGLWLSEVDQRSQTEQKGCS